MTQTVTERTSGRKLHIHGKEAFRVNQSGKCMMCQDTEIVKGES